MPELPVHAADRAGGAAAAGDLGAATAGGGRPLAAEVRARFEEAFSADLSAVRLHTGPAADEAARRYRARALTAGSDIVVRSGEHRPGTPAGDALLAHELTHVLQQAGGVTAGARAAGSRAALEEAATRNARAVTAGGRLEAPPRPAGRAVVTGNSSAGLLVQRQDDGAGVHDPVAEEVARAEEVLRPEIEWVLTDASLDAGLDLEQVLTAAVAEVLAGRDPDALARARATAAEIARTEEEVVLPVRGPVSYDIGTVLVELGWLHARASGSVGAEASAGVRQVVRTISGHAAQAIAAVLPGTPSFAPLYVTAVRHDVALAAGAVHDADALLRLELEGTVAELLQLRRAFALAGEEEERAHLGAEIGQTARRALLLNGLLAGAAGATTATTALDAAVEARAAEIAGIRRTAETEAATTAALGDDVTLLTAQHVTIRHGETQDEPFDPLGEPEHAETHVLPEEALPETTDTAERTMAGELADRVGQQREEVRRLRAQVVPEHPAYTVEEFAAVHRRWFGMYSLAQEQQDPTVRLVLDLLGEPYRLMGADVGSAVVAVEGGLARAYLMALGVDLMTGALHGETSQFGEQVRAGGLRRRTSVSGSAGAVGYRYGEVYAGPAAHEPGRGGEVRSRTELLTRRTGETAAAATALAALPSPVRAGQARRLGLVTAAGDVPLVGVRRVRAVEGWTYLTDVRSGPDAVLVAREQKTVAPEVAQYLLAAQQEVAALSATHVPTSGGRPLGSSATRSGGVEAAPATSAARYLRGESAPRPPREVDALSGRLAAAHRATGVRPGGPPPTPEELTAALRADLRAYLDAFFVERTTVEWRLAAIFALADTEHHIGRDISALLEPSRLAAMIAEAVKISAIVMTLQALGPLGAIAARAYQAHLAAQGVSNVAALISIAAFCRDASDADSLNRARAWGYMSRNIVQDAAELFENLVSTPVTAGMHALASSGTRPGTPQELAEAMGPLLADPAARDALVHDVQARIAALEAGSPQRTDPELEALRGFRDSLLGISRPETTAAARSALPGRTRPDVDAAAVLTSRPPRSARETAALRAALPADLASVPILESGAAGNAVRVRYGDDGGVRLEVGRDAGPEHLRRHARTVRELRRYEGVLGRIRVLLSRVWQAITGHPAYGTRGFEARLEVRKLNAILAELYGRELAVEARANRLLADDGADLAREAESIRRDIAEIERQLAGHERDLGSYEAGRGFVAAESTLRAGGPGTGVPLRESAVMASADQRLRTVEAALARDPALRSEYAGVVRALRVEYAAQRDVFLDFSPDTAAHSGGMRSLAASERALEIERQAAELLQRFNDPPAREPATRGFDNAAFLARMRQLSTLERIAFIEQTAGRVAAGRGLQYDNALSTLNRRSVYRDPGTGELFSVDTYHGSFERCAANGRHLEEVRFDFTHLDDRDATGGHDLKVP